MADNTTRVVYKAIADFSALGKAARRARKDIKDVQREEAQLNKSSVAGAAAATVAVGKHAKSREQLIEAFEKEAGATRKSTVQFMENATAARQAADATEELAADTAKLNTAGLATTKTFKDINGEWVKTSDSAEKLTRASRRNRQEMTQLGQSFTSTLRGAKQLDKGLDKLGNWRPRLIPPFIALIPIIGGVLALINPLVAGIGAVSVTALGFASSLGRVAGGAIAAVPALATLISLVAALKTAFGGIGGAFQAFGAMQDAAGGGGGGGAPARAELSQTEQITRAQEAYARSLQDVAWAQEDLDDARADYIDRLDELRRAVDRAALSEARAAANTQLARENYANVLADPGSTKGQKMDAKVGVDESVADQNDLVRENIANQRELIEMQRKGIEGDRQVIQAQRALVDAINRVRDAELELTNAQNGSGAAAGGAASAASEYEKMLAKLSPSARRFVETLVAMSDVWSALRRNVQEAFFSEFVDDVDKLRNILPSVESLLSNTAGAMGRVVSQLLNLITSPDWQRDLILIGENNVPIIENIGAALLSWVDAFKDIAVVAGPFLIALTDGLREGAANFRQIVADARADGSLASYLEEVREKMSQWWRIVKNIGMALFNFSSAASGFGDWLTDGLEKLTMDWRKAGEEAKKEGSPFQVFLEDIKPLLVEVRGLFGDFFRWFAATAGDPDNIRQFTDIIKMIRDDLGPSIGRILDMLTKSGVGEDFVAAIISIVEAIETVLANGGVDGIKAFFTTISDLFGALNGFLSAVPAPVLSLLATTFGTLAALRFFGLTSVLGLLVKLASSSRILGILDKIGFAFRGGSGSRSAPGFFGGGAPTAAGAPGTRRGPGGGAAVARGGAALAVGTAVQGGFAKGIDFITGLGKKVTPSAGANAGKGFSLIGSIAKGAGRGAGVGAIAGIIGTIAGDLIGSSAAAGSAGAGQRVGGNVLGSAAGGAGIGALVGSVVPGVGTAIGAAAGGVIGAGVGLATSDSSDIEAMMADWGNFFASVGEWLAGVGEGFMTWLTVDLPLWLAGVGEGFMTWLTVDLPTWLGTVATGFLTWLTVDLPYQLGFAVGLFWTWLTVDMPLWLSGVWTGFMNWLTVDMPAWISGVWTGFMNWLTVDMPAWLAGVWTGFMNWLTIDLPAWIGQAATNFWTWLTVDLPAWIGMAAAGFWNWLTVDIPAGIGQAASGFWKFLTEDIPGWIGTAADAFWTWLTVDIPNAISGMVGDFFGNFGQGFADSQEKRNGGVIRRASGGGVPGSGNTDTVRAMLTPGEFVIRKAVVSRIGMDNLIKLNSGVMSYAEMLQRAMAEQPGSSKPGKGSGGGIQMFNGGGLVPSLGNSTPPDGPDFGGFGGNSGGGGGGFVVENLNIMNPTPEPASDSLPRSIRKIAYVGSGARG